MDKPAQAAKIGIEEVGMPVIAADCTTVAAYLPMLLVPGIMGDFMGTMPIVVGMGLTGSILVDHILIPVAASLWFRQRIRPSLRPGEAPPEAPDGFFMRLYQSVLRWSLRNRWVVVCLSVYAVLWAGLMLYSGAIGRTFFPASDRGQFSIYYDLPLGYSIEETERVAELISEPLRELQASGEVRHFVVAVGSSSALQSPMEGDTVLGPEFGQIMVELQPPNRRVRHQDEIIAELREKIPEYPGMNFRIVPVTEGPPGGADVEVRLTGDNLEQLGQLGEKLAAELKRIKGTQDVQSDYRPMNPEITAEPDPAVVGLLGLNETDVAGVIATAIQGDTSLEMVADDEEITLRIQAGGEHQQYPDDIRRLMLVGPKGRQATVDEVADVRWEYGLFSVKRRDRRRAVQVSCSVIEKKVDPENGTLPVEVFAELRKILPERLNFRAADADKPADDSIGAAFLPAAEAMTFLGQTGTDAEGVRLEFTGENEEMQKNFEYLTKVMVLAVVLIAGILVLQFNSFRQTIIVLVTIPLSFVGVILGMWICDFPFSLASFIGLVSLAGVVVNDAIVMIDFTNQVRREGHPLEDALLDAGRKRLRAVMLTTVTTIGGLLPLFFNLSGGAEFWQPLTGAIIFGLMMASLLTLVVIPVFYSLAYGWRRAST